MGIFTPPWKPSEQKSKLAICALPGDGGAITPTAGCSQATATCPLAQPSDPGGQETEGGQETHLSDHTSCQDNWQRQQPFPTGHGLTLGPSKPQVG